MSKTNLVRPSRDGDQFHYSWAARRCLQLLSAQNDLVAISIEGPSPEEIAGEQPVSVGEEVIDIAEYFGSEDIQNARMVRYMQLKHSTLHATDTWTASGLEKTIKGFSGRYRELLKTFSADTLSLKLQFWFVTNRPIANNFAEAVADAAAGVASRHPIELKKLELFTGLKSNALAAFSKLLHFEDRQDDYWDQRNILFQDVNGYLPDTDVDAPTRLKELVTRKALSEGEQNPIITKMDVLRALNTDEKLLYPANCLIKTLHTALLRTQEPEIISKIIAATAPVIVHASAGVGKTVLATRIAHGLPDGSTSILYDCFGNGQYRNASGYRHRHKDALVQIANELAAKGLCHLLIPTSHADASAYVRAFIYRIGQAATLVRLTNPQALLCIVVDAADNAQMAAVEIGESRSFVRDLIREKMPEGVRLVFLCRSHRQDYLDPPVEVTRLELQPFSRDETAAYLRQRFSEVSEPDIDEFHRLSSQNPRVQALALSRNVTLAETLRLLGPNPKTVEDTIGILLEGAIAKLRDSVGPLEKDQVDSICAGLAALRPLIPIPILSQMSGVDENAIKSFAIDIGRPLLVAGDTIQFFDEPAETWFRERFKPSTSAMAEFIAKLTPIAVTSAYVASALPPLMLEAGKFSELVELALTSAALPETSPVEKRDVELQRLQFALKAGLRSKRYLDVTKLALKAGGETAGDDRQRKILQANTDLAGAFLESDLIQEIVSRRTFGSGWLGSHHAYEAALMSGRPELIGDARSRLRMAEEWLRNWSRLTPDERKDEEISDQDIVELTLAHLNIHGPANGAHSLGMWKPREVSFRVGRIVVRRLINHGRFLDVEEFARAAGNNLCLVLAVIVEFREIQRTLPPKITGRALRLVANTRVELKDSQSWDDRGSVLNAVSALVEMALQQAICSSDQAAAILSRYLPSEPPRAFSSRFSPARFPLLRAYCLRAALQGKPLALRDLAHPELKAEIEKNQHSKSSDFQEFEEDIGVLLPWYQLWATSLLGHVTQESLDNEVKRTREASKSGSQFYYRDYLHTTDQIALMWLDILHLLNAVDADSLGIFMEWKNGLKRPLFTPTLTALARLCSQKEKTKTRALGFALEAFNLIKNERSDAENKSEGYIDAARSILSVSRSDAAAYFNEAVEVASKIGDENLSRWNAILDLTNRAERLDRTSPEMAYHFARCAELTYDYVDRDKHFNWEATVQALCGLCPSSGLAILSRWRDRHFGWSERILPIAVDRLIERGVLNGLDALPLIGFRAQWTYDRLLDSALEKCETHEEKEAVTKYFYRYLQFNAEIFSKLKEVMHKHGIAMSDIDEAIAFYEKIKSADEEPKYKQTNKPNDLPKERNWNWSDFLSELDLTNVDDLSRAYRKLESTERPWNHDEFFQEVIRRVPIGSEATFIEAFGKVPTFDLYHLRILLKEVPDTWKGRPAVTRALAFTVKAFCRRYCMEITKNRYYEVLPFKQASDLTAISEAEIIGVVLDAVGEASNFAGAERLFSLVGLLVIKLSADEAFEALRFGLDLFNLVLEDKDGDGPWSSQLLPPSALKVSLAGYIWASMAAPEAALRWEGAHVVLGLVAIKRHDILENLIKFATENKGGTFVDANLPFYKLHALQWLLIGIARAATEFPAVLLPFASQIIDWALKDQPHVLIRQFAAKTILSLLNSGVLVDRDDLTRQLSQVNVSPFPVVNSGSYDRILPKKKDTSDDNDDDGYYFGLDIGPYWYAPLGRVFALSQSEIESQALKVIRTDFGSAGKGRWDEDARARRHLYEENQTHHSHGSHPRVDNLYIYHAYHAMMIVAGQLLATTPTHHDPRYSEEDEFADWLRDEGLSRKDGRWLWDRRDPMPREWPSWKAQKKDDANWRAITSDDFDEVLHSNNMLNVWGYWTVADSEWQQTTHIRSALVSPDKSLALLRALGTAKDNHDYAIPSADSDKQIEKSGFALKGWIVDKSRDRDLDGKDRWSGGVNFPPPSPSNDIIALVGLETDLDFRFWKDREGLVAMASQVWGHYDEAKRNQVSDPERGTRIQASLDFTSTMLAKLDRDMIIKVEINRRRRYQPYQSSAEDDKERIPTKAKLYLLGADGQFRTL